MDRYKILIHAESPQWGEALAQSFSQHQSFEVVAETNGDLLKSISSLSVEVLVMQIEKRDPFLMIEQIGNSLPFIKTVVITKHPDKLDMAELLRLGVRGCLPATLLPKQIVTVVEQMIITDIACFPRPRDLSNYSKPHAQIDRLDKLTNREQEILVYLSKNLSNQEIAGCLFLSESTVKTHVRNIMHKLGAKNRMQAITMVQQYGAASSDKMM
jgi:DNA-binding NarL/FixJ family response regulator